MTVQEFLDKVAYIGPSEIPDDSGKVYYTKFDNSYLTRVGMEDHVKFLADREITESLSHGTGYSPLDNKWYGWSHRAIYGFTIGSTCIKGDCHYRAANLQDEIEDAIRFWSGDNRTDIKATPQEPGRISVSWKYDEIDQDAAPCFGHANWFYKEGFGRGEWIAETMEDAKEMAFDFCEGVS